MITEREVDIIDRAVKVSAYSDEDAVLILRALIVEKNEEIAGLNGMVDLRDVAIDELEHQIRALQKKLAEIKGVDVSDPDQ